MLKEIPESYTESIGKPSCRNVTSITKEASSDHDIKDSESRIKVDNTVAHDV